MTRVCEELVIVKTGKMVCMSVGARDCKKGEEGWGRAMREVNRALVGREEVSMEGERRGRRTSSRRMMMSFGGERGRRRKMRYVEREGMREGKREKNRKKERKKKRDETMREEGGDEMMRKTRRGVRVEGR